MYLKFGKQARNLCDDVLIFFFFLFLHRYILNVRLMLEKVKDVKTRSMLGF